MTWYDHVRSACSSWPLLRHQLGGLWAHALGSPKHASFQSQTWPESVCVLGLQVHGTWAEKEQKGVETIDHPTGLNGVEISVSASAKSEERRQAKRVTVFYTTP